MSAPPANVQDLLARLAQMSSRVEKSRAAATWLFFEAGEHPSVQRVRELTGLGSTSDIARDLRQFWEEVRKRLHGRIHSPDLPDAVVEYVNAFVDEVWVLALDRAQGSLDKERQRIQSDLAQAHAQILQAQADAQAQRDMVSHLQDRLKTAQSQQESDANAIGALRAEKEALERAAQTALEQHQSDLVQRDELITALRAEQERMVQAQKQQMEVSAGEIRFAKLQIENARGEARHWKAEFERERNDSTVRLSILEQRLSAERESSGSSQMRAEQSEKEVAQLRGQLAALRAFRKALQQHR